MASRQACRCTRHTRKQYHAHHLNYTYICIITCHGIASGVPLADAGHFRFRNKTLCRNHYEEVALGRCVKCDSPLRGEFVSLAHKSGLLGLLPCENKPSGGKAAPGMCRKCFQCAHWCVCVCVCLCVNMYFFKCRHMCVHLLTRVNPHL